jgi:hypothetical protein
MKGGEERAREAVTPVFVSRLSHPFLPSSLPPSLPPSFLPSFPSSFPPPLSPSFPPSLSPSLPPSLPAQANELEDIQRRLEDGLRAKASMLNAHQVMQ